MHQCIYLYNQNINKTYEQSCMTLRKRYQRVLFAEALDLKNLDVLFEKDLLLRSCCEKTRLSVIASVDFQPSKGCLAYKYPEGRHIWWRISTMNISLNFEVSVVSHLEMVSSQCMGFPMNLGTFNAYNTQLPKIHVPQFIIKSVYYSHIPTIQQSHIHFPSQQSPAISYTLPLEHVE